MTPAIIFAALVCQILFAVIGGLIWWRSGSKPEMSWASKMIATQVKSDTQDSISILDRIASLLQKHRGELDTAEKDFHSVKEPSGVGKQLTGEVDRLTEVLEGYNDLYHEERADLRNYADRAEQFEELLKDVGRSPEREQRLLVLVSKMQSQNEDLRETVARCREDISELIIRTIRAERDTRVDSLTRLPNRLAWAERRQSIETDHRGVAVIAIDIDDLEMVNQRHGRDAGNAVLQLVAKILRESQNMSVYRKGGDEFVAITPCKSLSEAFHRAEATRCRIENAQVNFQSSRISITASFGVAFAANAEQLDAALNGSVQALATAKVDGKNRVDTQENGEAAAEPVTLVHA